MGFTPHRSQLKVLPGSLPSHLGLAYDSFILALQAAQRTPRMIEYRHEKLKYAADPSSAGRSRRLAMTLGRALELALLVEQAQWCLEQEHNGRARAAALPGSYALVNDEPLPANLD